MRRMCCVCQKTQWEGDWRLLPIASDEPITHGYCPECYAEVMAELQMVVARRESAGPPVFQGLWQQPLNRGGACV